MLSAAINVYALSSKPCVFMHVRAKRGIQRRVDPLGGRRHQPPRLQRPYTKDTRQEGVVSYGISHLMKLIGTGEMAQRSSWYQKWNVHMFPRPEVRLDITNNVTLCVGDDRGIVCRESSLAIDKLP